MFEFVLFGVRVFEVEKKCVVWFKYVYELGFGVKYVNLVLLYCYFYWV